MNGKTHSFWLINPLDCHFNCMGLPCVCLSFLFSRFSDFYVDQLFIYLSAVRVFKRFRTNEKSSREYASVAFLETSARMSILLSLNGMRIHNHTTPHQTMFSSVQFILERQHQQQCRFLMQNRTGYRVALDMHDSALTSISLANGYSLAI